MTSLRVWALALAATATLCAQGNTGAILGTVTDASGGVVPGAAVTVSNVDTGVAIPATTNGAGEYAARSINPGRYTVQAVAAGFKKFRRENVNLDIGRELRIDIGLETGAVTESVVVSATAPLLETETGALRTAIESRQLEGLPRRSVQDLAGLVPGMASTGQDPQANGGIGGKDPILIDGAPSLLQVNTGVSSLPNVDMVQ
jgi:hypothetical protein